MTLGDRIAAHLAGTGRPLTAREIAGELHVRHADVLDVLKTDERFYLWPDPHGRRRPYGVRAVEGDSELGTYALNSGERSGAAA